MKFRLGTMAYGFALLAAGMAAFGAVEGIFLSIAVLAGWWFVSVREWGVALGICMGGAAACAIYSSMTIAEPNRRGSCALSMKQIMLGIMNYESDHGVFPPPYVADADGKPMHSWRVMILPYLEQQELYEKYRFDEAWDGPHNRKLWDETPDFYRCPGCEHCIELGLKPFGVTSPQAAHYFAVVGDETAWPTSRAIGGKEVRDGLRETVFVVEHTGMNVPWTAPEDLALDEAVKALTTNEVPGHLRASEGSFEFSATQTGRTIGYGDGLTEYFAPGLDEETARGFFTIAGGESREVSLREAEALRSLKNYRRATAVRYDRVYAFLAFVGLAVWPGVRMWRRA